jgi:hypothetical protein
MYPETSGNPVRNIEHFWGALLPTITLSYIGEASRLIFYAQLFSVQTIFYRFLCVRAQQPAATVCSAAARTK